MTDRRFEDWSPALVQRHCGGWLAVAAPHDPIKIGVTAGSEADARCLFLARREELGKRASTRTVPHD